MQTAETKSSLKLETFSSLTLARYEFRLQAREEVELPALLGSTLRGAFGHAFKAIACSVAHQDCNRCPLRDVCVYPTFFESQIEEARNLLGKNQSAPRPYIFQPPMPPLTRRISQRQELKLHVAAGASLSFNLIIFGTERHKLPYVIYAVSLMAQHGLGAARAPFDLAEVAVLNEMDEKSSIYTSQAERIAPHENHSTTLDTLVAARLREIKSADRVTLRLLTPLRVREQGAVQETLSCLRLINNLSRRLALLNDAYGLAPRSFDYKALLAQAATVRTERADLWRHEFERLSNRQHKKISQDGMLGEITFHGDALEVLLPLLVAGEFLQVGSGTPFGLGRYRIVS
jgi:CRISPR/Cas system endoribonuclease Cas6 (RAMP superfamily)